MSGGGQNPPPRRSTGRHVGYDRAVDNDDESDPREDAEGQPSFVRTGEDELADETEPDDAERAG